MHLKHKLNHYAGQGRLRDRIAMTHRSYDNNFIVINKQPSINFSSNDYLGLSKHPKIMEAFIKSVRKYGFGSGASSQVSGYLDSHAELETQFSQWLGTDKAILFSSGYLANLGVMTALADRHSTIFSDKCCHASILEGIQLSRARHYRYQHASVAHLKQLAKNHKPDLIVTESVFSMEGNIAPIEKIIKLSKAYHANMVIDDAHGMGILGENGRGICEYANLKQEDFSCLVVPLGKAFNGIGAMVTGKSDVMDAILQFAKTYRYSTALPPAMAVALQACLDAIKESGRRERLNQNINFFMQYAKFKNISLVSSDLTPIKAILIGNNQDTLLLQGNLLSQGFFVACIRSPTVPENTARLRVSLNSVHTQKEIMCLLDAIQEGMRKL